MNDTQPPDEPSPEQPQQPRNGVVTENLRNYEQLRRSTTNRKIAGVAGGLGRHLNIDPTVLRVVLVVLVFFGGAGLVLYAAAWLIVPVEGTDEAIVSARPATRNALLIVAGVFAGLLLLGDSWNPGGGFFPWPLALIALVILAVVLATRERPGSGPAAGGPGTQAGEPAPWAPSAGPEWTAPPTAPTATTGTPTGAFTSTPPGPSTAADAAPPAPPWGSSGMSYAPVPPPPSKRDRGPKLFGFTLAFIAIALGSLGLYEALGGAVQEAAYPALALAVIGAMLVWGSFAGRPGGLIFLGIVTSIVLVVTAAVDGINYDGSLEIDEAPQSAAELSDGYAIVAGDIRLDLTQIRDPQRLAGRTVVVQAEAGEIFVIVPEGIDVGVNARVSFAGDINVDGAQDQGGSPEVVTVIDGGEDVPQINFDIDLTAGSINVTQLQEANAL